ncbi:hypothetical protein KP509_21G017500 [Ceratopteris richardii]|nr:hypothetical protein KP509_21G017500 [Ceratopteris richardii]
MAGFFFLAAMSALCKALSYEAASEKRSSVQGPSEGVKKDSARKGDGAFALTERQQVLLGLSGGKQKVLSTDKLDTSDSSIRHRLPHTRSVASPQQSSLLVPVHTPSSSKNGRATSSSISSWAGAEWSDANKVSPVSKMQSPPYVCLAQNQVSPVDTQSSPWTTSASPLMKDDITTEHKLEEFLANVDDRLVESSVKVPATVQQILTPPPSLRGVNLATPVSGATPSSTSKGTPVRALRISPSPQKFGPSPRTGDGDLSSPMTPEQTIEAFEKLGVYPQIEQWRDKLRQWFSKDLLNPLVSKIDTSHLQVMQAAAKLGISVNVNPVSGSKLETPRTSQTGADISAQDWSSTFSVDEDAVLHQLQLHLLQARDASPAPQPSVFGSQQVPSRPVIPAIQECLDAVSEHQRLKALMKGEWAKGLLPQSSVRADYTVHRIRELAEGTCVKKYEYLATGELYDKIAKRWTLELPTDSHLLLYLFGALLEHPKWMLHIDQTSQPSIQSANNPLFVVHLPNKERCPEKHVAILSSAPPFLHAGACVLAVGKQSPPVFALYWEKKLQFALQGRTALWDSVLLFCHRIQAAHGSVVQGINLGSSAFNLLPIFEVPEEEDCEH